MVGRLLGVTAGDRLGVGVALAVQPAARLARVISKSALLTCGARRRVSPAAGLAWPFDGIVPTSGW
jgi:hypothetical protein